MTLVEMVVAVLAVGAALFLLVGWSRQVRRDAKIELARRVLIEVDRALILYHRVENAYPPAPDGEAATLVFRLLRHPKTKQLAGAISDSLWSLSRPRALLDPWGTALRCLTDPKRDPSVGVNGGRPVFVSAGPDRDFGDVDRSRLGDNLRSDDPDEHGFREDRTVDAPTSRADDSPLRDRARRE